MSAWASAVTRGTAENRQDYLDRAIIEYTAAVYHAEQAGHEQYGASTENNLAFLLYKLGRYGDAHKHLDRAQAILTRLTERVIWKDGGLRERLSVELWLRPRAAVPPQPTPTVDPAEATVNDCGAKRRGRRGRLAGRAEQRHAPDRRHAVCYVHRILRGGG